jgi:hypothetical protein
VDFCQEEFADTRRLEAWDFPLAGLAGLLIGAHRVKGSWNIRNLFGGLPQFLKAVLLIHGVFDE